MIGDVVGKGVQAAAGMGQLRNALRAYILEGFDCGEALTRLNRLVDNLGRRQFATVVCVRFDPRTRRAALLVGRASVAGAGRARRGGHVPLLDARSGRRSARSRDVDLSDPRGASCEPDSRLLLYTDGLVEDRRTGIDTGLAELTADVAKPAEHVEDLLDTLLAKAARQTRRDDIALLALQATEPREFVLRLPADPARLSVLRRRLEDFLTAHGVRRERRLRPDRGGVRGGGERDRAPVDPAEPVITVEASLDDDAVLVTVRDTGGGGRPSGRASAGAGWR